MFLVEIVYAERGPRSMCTRQLTSTSPTIIFFTNTLPWLQKPTRQLEKQIYMPPESEIMRARARSIASCTQVPIASRKTIPTEAEWVQSAIELHC